jgi:hypothetical protein
MLKVSRVSPVILTTVVFALTTSPAWAGSVRIPARLAARIGIELARFPELIVPFFFIAGVTFAITQDAGAALTMPLVIGFFMMIFHSCAG